MKTASYETRAEKHSSEVARTLLSLMAQKKTNLCVSVDVTTKAALLRLVDAVGPYCCLIKVLMINVKNGCSRVLRAKPAITPLPSNRRILTFSPTLMKTRSQLYKSSVRNTTSCSLKIANSQTLVGGQVCSHGQIAG